MIVTKRVMLTTTVVDSAPRLLTVRERLSLNKWWVTAKAAFFGLLFGGILWAFLASPPSPANAQMGGIPVPSDLMFSAAVVLIYLIFMAFEIITLPQPVLDTEIDRRNAEAASMVGK